MSISQTQPNMLVLRPGRGLRELSIPCDPAGFTGTSGIHFNNVLGGLDLIAGVPLAAQVNGATYLSNIHGGLGSDARNPAGVPSSSFNANAPAFSNPEVTGFYNPPSPSAMDPKANGLFNTEKVLRSPSDAQAGANNGTIWTETQGRFNLNFNLWISRSAAYIPGLSFTLQLYRDLNAQDKVAGQFGAGAGPGDVFNAQLVQSWTATPALRNQNMPNFVTPAPVPISAGCNLYMLFFASDFAGGNLAVGSIWLS